MSHSESSIGGGRTIPVSMPAVSYASSPVIHSSQPGSRKADFSIGVLGDSDEWIRIVRFRAGTSRIRRCGLGTREQHLRAGPEKYEDLAVPVMDGRKGGHAELAF
jgi:hypothetical protein